MKMHCLVIAIAGVGVGAVVALRILAGNPSRRQESVFSSTWLSYPST